MDGRVSLIIPVRDEEHSIPYLLDSIMAQTMLPDEVVITDAGSKDRTVQMIESYAAKKCSVRIIKAGPAYPGRARNIAIEASSHDLIAMTDAGIRLDKNWLKELIRSFEGSGGLDVVYGDYEPARDTFFKRCAAIVFVPEPKELSGRKMRSHFIASSLMKKTVWRSVGGFPEIYRAAEDRIFMESIEKKGYKITFAPDANVIWDIPSTPARLFKRFASYSYHDIKAGRMREWHYPVMRMYAAGAFMMLFGILASRWFFILIFLGVMGRTLGLIWERDRKGIFNPVKFSMVMALMILVDIAMFAGMARYAVERLIKKR